MPETPNLASEIERLLPPDLVAFLGQAGAAAARRRIPLYLAGGAVRDVLLKRPVLDLDLVVAAGAADTGGAAELAASLAAGVGARLTVHSRFRTARLQWGGRSVDIATMRSETYDRPGALPRIGPGTLATDLFRRDFTVNAMAVELASDAYGRLIDLHGGQADLERRSIRVLHTSSFRDDPTRIWRAIRYEQRLGFRIERTTLALLRRDIAGLDDISGERLRHELELVLEEAFPEKALGKAARLGVLARLHPSLEAGAWLGRQFRRARRQSAGAVQPALYLGLLGYRLTDRQVSELEARLKLPRSLASILKDALRLKESLDMLARPHARPSEISHMLSGISPAAIEANRAAADSDVVRRRLASYMEHLRYVKPVVTGHDLEALGLPPGPQMSQALERLRDARLDGKVRSRQDETDLVTREFGLEAGGGVAPTPGSTRTSR